LKETSLTKAIDNVLSVKLKAVENFMNDYVEPLLDVGNPEKLINKKYEDWTIQDTQMLSVIYGDKLEDYIFNKAYKEVKELEKE
jgi:hypothetical protein